MELNSLRPLSKIEELSQQWIEKMLSDKFCFPIVVHSWTTRVPSGREGFLSEIAYLKIQYSAGDGIHKDLQLVLKILPEDLEVRQFMANGGLAKREVDFYKFANSQELMDICATCGFVLPVPETYFSVYEDNAISIVMHDLSVNKCKSVIVKEGSNLGQTKIALQAIAQIHATGLIYIKKYGETNENLLSLASFDPSFYVQYIVPNMSRIVEITKGTPGSESVRNLIPVAESMFSYHERYPFLRTIVHGDFWAGQLLYTEDETAAYTIDWQFCRLDNPVLDIVAMFFMSSDPQILERHMDELLHCYWKALHKPLHLHSMTLEVTFEQFVENVDNLLMFGFGILSVSIHDFLGAGNITNERIIAAVNFLEKRGAFSRFLNLVRSGN